MSRDKEPKGNHRVERGQEVQVVNSKPPISIETEGSQVVISMTRRQFTVAVGTFMASLFGFAATGGVLASRGYSEDHAKQVAEEEAMEKLRNRGSFQKTLDYSLLSQDELSDVYRDNVISPHSVSNLLLDGKFRYRGSFPSGEQGEDNLSFAMIGRRSGFLNREGKGANIFDSTTWPDAINTLIDYQNLSDFEIRSWISQVYQQSFDTKLDPAGILLKRDQKTNKIISVKYNPPVGFVNQMSLSVPREMEEVAPSTPGGNTTSRDIWVPIMNKNNRLFLQSGVSPYHDIKVPPKLLPKSKGFTLPLGGSGSWKLKTEDLSEELDEYSKRRRSNQGNNVSRPTSYGRTVTYEKIAPYVDIDPSRMKQLGDFLAKKVEPKDIQGKVEAISKFVQAFKYKSENGIDHDRPPLATIFNKGSDCNNKLVLWSSIMAALKIDHAILHVAPKKGKKSGHVVGAIPVNLLTDIDVAKARIHKGYVMIELTNPFGIGVDSIPGDEILFMEQIGFDQEGKMKTAIV